MRVLVVEDHEELAETIAIGLRREGMAVDVVLDGAAALQRAAVYGYEVIVLDRDLPEVHGDRVCQQLLERGGSARVLMLFDGLLSRLEMAFDSQRRFVANASHELRTPITVGRTLAEVALADPHADVASLRSTCERVIAAGEEQEQLIEALLTLARSERGLDSPEVFDLGEITREAALAVAAGSVAIDAAALEPAGVRGDQALAERLVVNLIGNAVRHNVPGGWVRIRTTSVGGRATLQIANPGPAVAPAAVPALLEPFRRGGGPRSGDGQGHGLGLSIVAAIARAHGAELSVLARDGGGLAVEVTFAPV